MEPYTEEYYISSHDTDPKGVAKPSVILRIFQEAANHQMRDERPSYMELYEQGRAFILSRIIVKTYIELGQYDKLKVQAWPSRGKGVTFYRCYRMFRGDEVAAEAFGIWALVDISSQALCKTTDVDLSGYTFGEKLDIPGIRFHLPEETMEKVGEHEVTYTQTDCNHHMNNTNYPDMLADFIPEIATHYVISVAIHYISEAPMGEKLSVFRSAPVLDGEEITYYFRTEKDGATNIQAAVTVRKA